MIFFLKDTLLFITLSISVTFVFSYLINSILLKFSQNLGQRSKSQSEVRWSSNSKPSLGGISFYVIFLMTFITLTLINNLLPLHFSNLKIIGILIVCTLAFLMGLADDAYNTKPLLKFLIQLICGLVLYFTHTKISVFTNETLNFGFTVFWVVGLMNSINMLDNMDGITTIVTIVILAFVISLNFHLGTVTSATCILSIGVLGSLLGFLIYNWHPSKMFMGDTGSQFLGVFLAIVGIEYCWNSFSLISNAEHNLPLFLLVFLITICVFILPLIDTTTVFINRLKRGNSPLIGGKDHTTHHLFFKGITEKRIAILFFCIQIIGIYLALNLILNYQFYWLIIAATFCLIVFLALYLNTVIKRK